MCFGAACATKVNMDCLAAACTSVLVNFRLSTDLIKVRFIEDCLNEIGASSRALAEIAMTVDNVFGFAGHLKLQSTA